MSKVGEPKKLEKVLPDLYRESESKTKSSKRNIVLTGFALDALKQHHVRQEEIRRAAGDLWEVHE